ncbi:hypothetical protein K3163_08105 [Qipengyuania sp. 1NDW9]|uniref:hypothetical protein n=1 Tax=Qipengyuania xiapuensis TaxID=2867236 RepID=UPI001C87EEC0|nr:hypothetical protein [Qipengyuania xiapuensis]MBX7493169.1 hypothetical protein [Qipengyuania xiapuensis]
MNDAENKGGSGLREALARADATLAGIEPILGHLLSAPDHSLFSDEIVARVRGMVADLARQILRAQAEATGESGRDAFVERHGEALREHLQGFPDLLLHCHALAIEWQLTERLEAQLGLDPVLSGLMQRMIADADGWISSGAMAALAAQARYAQAQRRMELPLGELTGDLFHRTLLAWRDYCGDGQSDAVSRAETRLRSTYDESAGRLALFARLVSALGDRAKGALVIEDAGCGLFFSALAALSSQSRDLAVLASHGKQAVRLALSLRAAGMEAGQVDELLLMLHPGGAPIAGLAEMSQREAMDLLSSAGNPGATR